MKTDLQKAVETINIQDTIIEQSSELVSCVVNKEVSHCNESLQQLLESSNSFEEFVWSIMRLYS